MHQPGSFHRIRLLTRVFAVVALLLLPAAASAQGSSSFTLTSASWTCANPTMQTAWTAQGAITAVVISATNTSLDQVEIATVMNPAQSSHSMVLADLDRIDKVTVRAHMADGGVWVYYANVGNCDTAGTITGGREGEDSGVTISITDATCSGFNWSVSSPDEVRVYVSVMDTIGDGMIPFVPQNGTVLSGSESYVVTTENQTYFNIMVGVYDPVSNEEIVSQSRSMECPIASGSTPTPMPTVTPSVTPDVDDDETTVTIQVNLAGGESIEGAPYSVFAPMAAQFAAQPYRTGVVGANNTISLTGLIPGDYRLLIEPDGMDPIDVVFTVGTSQVTDLVLTVDADGNATVAPRQPVPVPTAASDSGSAPASPVDALPTTGAGASQSASPVMALGLLAAMMTLAGLLVRQRFGDSCQ